MTASTSVPASNTTYYAHWTIDEYTIRFHANGGHHTDGSDIQTVTKTSGSTLGTLPTVTRTGYTSNGWWTESVGGLSVTTSTIPTGDTTYYAHWTPNSVYYTVTFDLNGGSGTTPAPKTVAAGSSVELPSLASS